LTIAAWQRAYAGIFTPDFLAALSEPGRVQERIDITRRRLMDPPQGMAEFIGEFDGIVVGWARAAAGSEAEIEACGSERLLIGSLVSARPDAASPHVASEEMSAPAPAAAHAGAVFFERIN